MIKKSLTGYMIKKNLTGSLVLFEGSPNLALSGFKEKLSEDSNNM